MSDFREMVESANFITYVVMQIKTNTLYLSFTVRAYIGQHFLQENWATFFNNFVEIVLVRGKFPEFYPVGILNWRQIWLIGDHLFC